MADFADEVVCGSVRTQHIPIVIALCQFCKEYYQLESLARLIRDLRQKEKKSAAFYWEVDSSV
jgi:hypothetical protein